MMPSPAATHPEVEPVSEPSHPAAEDPGREDEAVPLFGTWPRIYLGVIVTALVVMALVALFARWPY
jgi:hypothetical protein